MCVMSMVMDHYSDKFPWATTPLPAPQDKFQKPAPIDWTKVFTKSPANEAIAELRKLIAEFREAVAAAAKVDRLTGQPDCVDPQKGELERRVEALEQELNRIKKALSGS